MFTSRVPSTFDLVQKVAPVSDRLAMPFFDESEWWRIETCHLFDDDAKPPELGQAQELGIDHSRRICRIAIADHPRRMLFFTLNRHIELRLAQTICQHLHVLFRSANPL